MNSAPNNPVAQADKLLPLSPTDLSALWNMIEFFPAKLFGALNSLKGCMERAKDLQDAESQFELKECIRVVEDIEKYAQLLELSSTKDRCEQFKHYLGQHIIPPSNAPAIVKALHTSPDQISTEKACSESEGILAAVSKELRLKKFTYIPVGKTQFFEQEKMFGVAVYDQFQSARVDIKEAGNCVAVGSNTAAVFHLMRVVEYGMRAMAAHLKAGYKKKEIDYAQWNNIIDRIRAKIAKQRLKYDKSKRKNREELESLKLYGALADELNIFKEIWRNNVMHTRGIYTEPEAMNVFVRVRDFMQRLATKVSELKN